MFVLLKHQSIMADDGVQPPQPLNLGADDVVKPPPPLNLRVDDGVQPPPPLNLVLGAHSRSSENFNAFMVAQTLSIEEGTSREYGFTTSPRLTDEQNEEWEKERIKGQEEARHATEYGIDLNPNKKIKFSEDNPPIHFYTPESSNSGGPPECGDGGASNN